MHGVDELILSLERKSIIFVVAHRVQHHRFLVLVYLAAPSFDRRGHSCLIDAVIAKVLVEGNPWRCCIFVPRRAAFAVMSRQRRPIGD